MEDMTVVGMNHPNPAILTSLKIHTEACQSPEGSCFGGVGMDDMWPVMLDDPLQGLERTQVLDWRDLPAHAREEMGIHTPQPCEIGHITLSGAYLSANQERLKPFPVKVAAQGHGLNGRPSDVKPRDNS
jgi:hypothetical protein